MFEAVIESYDCPVLLTKQLKLVEYKCTRCGRVISVNEYREGQECPCYKSLQ